MLSCPLPFYRKKPGVKASEPACSFNLLCLMKILRSRRQARNMGRPPRSDRKAKAVNPLPITSTLGLVVLGVQHAFGLLRRDHEECLHLIIPSILRVNLLLILTDLKHEIFQQVNQKRSHR